MLWRNRWLMNPEFQRWSMRLPLLRGPARHHANEMFRTITGFVYTKTLTAAVDLGIIATLAEAPASTADLAAAGDLPLPAMQRLLTLCADRVKQVEVAYGKHLVMFVFPMTPTALFAMTDSDYKAQQETVVFSVSRANPSAKM